MRVTNHNTAWKGSTAWMEEAACKNKPRVFFFPDGDDWVDPRAGGICAVCPVKDECLDFALRNPSLDGIWGGTSEEERRRIRRQRRRAVPAQAPARPQHHHH
jgi:WhiB family transcriptional regulator, redox-sensing transcriptional regulator